jgi:FtsK/SpoIIIE family/FHA domain/zinc-ribbon domain
MSDADSSTISPRLEWLSGPLAGQKMELAPGYLIVGREPACCQVLIEADVVSRRHASLEADGAGEVTLVDLASTNGTFVNGTRISRRALQDGDLVSFGPDGAAGCVFRAMRALAASPAPDSTRAALPVTAASPVVPAVGPDGSQTTDQTDAPPRPVEQSAPLDGPAVAEAEATVVLPANAKWPAGAEAAAVAPAINVGVGGDAATAFGQPLPVRPFAPPPVPALIAEQPTKVLTDTPEMDAPANDGAPREARPAEGGAVGTDARAAAGEGFVKESARVCADCGAELGDGARFCTRCGKETASRTPVAPVAEPNPPTMRSSLMPKQKNGEKKNGEKQPRPSGMPQKMRDIVRNLNGLMDDYNQTLARLAKQRDEALAQAAQKLEDAKRHYETDVAGNDAKLKSEEAEADRVKNEVDNKKGAALSHLSQQNVSPPYQSSLSLSGRTSSANGLVEARNQLGEIDRRLTALRHMEKPKNSGKMIATFGIIGFFISICAATGAGSGAVFLVINLLATGVPAIIALVSHSSVTSAMQDQYDYLLAEAERAFDFLKSFREQAKEQHRLEVSRLGERMKQAHSDYKQAVAAAEKRYKTELDDYTSKTNVKIGDAKAVCASFYAETGFAGLRWDETGWAGWGAADSPLPSSCLGSLESPQFGFSVPAMLSFNDAKGGRCLLLKATGKQKERANLAVQSVMLRLLANVPPGKVLFTLIDPVGLGQNVAPFMPLADFEEKLITSRAWTEPRHIEEQLSKLTEHMENVIQKYLRNDYATIEEYNESAGEVAEPYRVLVVLDFPVNFSDEAARRLVSIARNGPRCGVYTIIIRDTAKEKPHGFNFADLEQAANVIEYGNGNGARPAAAGKNGDAFVWRDSDIERYSVSLDAPPRAELFKAIIEVVGEKSKDAMRVEVPFDRLLEMSGLTREARWHGSACDKLQVPLGPSGAKKVQYLTFGKGTEHHAVVIGMPGSGKSNLMHIIVTSLAMIYPPEEVQLYLIDFKQGVEFKRYAQVRLPHAKVIAIESEREFGLSVLKGLDEELHRRGESFRRVGVNAIGDYRKSFPDERLPRVLLLVDEFQEFFSYDDNIGREANLLLDRLIRQGRYAGIHVMLGSQSLANRSALPSSTLGQVGIRIALKCSESDARQIMADDNPQARLLSRPGEAIYNAASGLIEGNNFFQVALFTEEDRQARLDEICALAAEAESRDGVSLERPIIFEGNEPSRLEECAPLCGLLGRADYEDAGKSKDLWLGEPVAIRPPTSARLRRQGASNLLIVTRDEEEGVGMLTAALLSLAAQVPPSGARFLFVDLSTADSPWSSLAEDLADVLPHKLEILGRRDVPGAVKELAALVSRRAGGEGETSRDDGGEVYFIIQGLHRARDLREEEARGRGYLDREERGQSVPELFAMLLREGPECGVHVLAWCDAYANVRRSVGRGLNEFALRVAGAMSEEDSRGLLDEAAASKLDKPHRAIFFDDERPGRLEKFRPYAIPERGWLEGAARALRDRAGKYRTTSGG